jgi:creatinine amidohydrolase/Fe(II)-dependent formamide hydrolase-like protein
LKSTGVAPEFDLWETVRMAKKQFVPAAGDIVISLYKRGIFKVLAISHGGQTAAIQSFNISKQKLLGQPLETCHATRCFHLRRTPVKPLPGS